MLRYKPGDLSFFNIAGELRLPDMTPQQIQEIMEAYRPGTWDEGDAKAVARATGGHPYLVWLVIDAWVANPKGGWKAAESAIPNDGNYVRPTLGSAFGSENTREILRRCVEGPDLSFNRYEFHEDGSAMKLYYDGILRRGGPNDERLVFRCAAIENLVREGLGES